MPREPPRGELFPPSGPQARSTAIQEPPPLRSLDRSTIPTARRHLVSSEEAAGGFDSLDRGRETPSRLQPPKPGRVAPLPVPASRAGTGSTRSLRLGKPRGRLMATYATRRFGSQELSSRRGTPASVRSGSTCPRRRTPPEGPPVRSRSAGTVALA